MELTRTQFIDKYADRAPAVGAETLRDASRPATFATSAGPDVLQRTVCALTSCRLGGDEFDRTDISTFLKKIAVTITSRIGGTSGPIWGTGFLRAATTAAGEDSLDADRIVAMLRAAIEGIKARGGAEFGDKTLLDALIPATDAIEERAKAGSPAAETLRAAAESARHAGARRDQCSRRRGVPRIPASAASAPSTLERSPWRCYSRHCPSGIRPRHDVEPTEHHLEALK